MANQTLSPFLQMSSEAWVTINCEGHSFAVNEMVYRKSPVLTALIQESLPGECGLIDLSMDGLVLVQGLLQYLREGRYDQPRTLEEPANGYYQLRHAADMYAIGQKYELLHLQELALESYIQYTVISRNAMGDIHPFANAILWTIPMVYTSIPASDRRLRDFVADLVTMHQDAFTSMDDGMLGRYQRTLGMNPGFSLDFLHRWIAARRVAQDQE